MTWTVDTLGLVGGITCAASTLPQTWRCAVTGNTLSFSWVALILNEAGMVLYMAYGVLSHNWVIWSTVAVSLASNSFLLGYKWWVEWPRPSSEKTEDCISLVALDP